MSFICKSQEYDCNWYKQSQELFWCLTPIQFEFLCYVLKFYENNKHLLRCDNTKSNL